MAKLRATPKTYAQAAQVLGDRLSLKLGNNTYLELTGQRDFIGVRLHSTYIVKFWADRHTTLHTGGWQTVTTKDRINEFITGRVYQKNHEWFYVVNRGELGLDWGNPIAFTERMNVGQKPDVELRDRAQASGEPTSNCLARKFGGTTRYPIPNSKNGGNLL